MSVHFNMWLLYINILVAHVNHLIIHSSSSSNSSSSSTDMVQGGGEGLETLLVQIFTWIDFCKRPIN